MGHHLCTLRSLLALCTRLRGSVGICVLLEVILSRPEEGAGQSFGIKAKKDPRKKALQVNFGRDLYLGKGEGFLYTHPCHPHSGSALSHPP